MLLTRLAFDRDAACALPSAPSNPIPIRSEAAHRIRAQSRAVDGAHLGVSTRCDGAPAASRFPWAALTKLQWSARGRVDRSATSDSHGSDAQASRSLPADDHPYSGRPYVRV